MKQMTLIDSGPTLMDIALSDPALLMDPCIQQGVGLDVATVAEYRELYAEGYKLGRLTLFYDGEAYRVADGFHRCEAARQAGKTTLPAEVRPGGHREALLYAMSCNLHGKPLTNQDKRKRVLTLLQDPEWCLWADNHIARHCGVSHTFVSRLRDSLATVASEHRKDAPNQPATRQYINKHGQQVTMQVDAIGQRNSKTPCADCGRPLTDADSIRRGVGPVCACKTTSAASGSASPRRFLQDASDSEQATLAHDQGQQADEEKARKAAEERAERQTCACAEAVQYLGELATDYGLEVVETQIVAVFLAAHGRPAPASHVSQAVDPGAMPGEVRQATPTTPGQAPQTGLAAMVRAALPTYGPQGTTAGALAKVLGVSNDKTWRNLERLVKQGKARKEGTTYIFLAEQAHA